MTKRNRLKRLIDEAEEVGLITPSDVVLDLAREQTQDLIDALKLKLNIRPQDLPLFTLTTPGAVPAPKEKGLILTSNTDGWEKIAAHTVYMGLGGGGGGTMTGAQILAALLPVDGAGSLLDADLLDGNEAAAFALSGHNHAGVYEPADATILKSGNANWIDLTDGGATILHTHAAYLTAETDPLSLHLDGANKLAVDVLHTNNYDLTIPATGTAALLATANVFTAAQTIKLSNTALAHQIFGDSATSHLDIFTPSQNTPVPDYANAGGTGDRSALITVSTTLTVTGSVAVLVNGDKSTNNFYFGNQAVSGKYILFTFTADKVITEAKFYQQNTTAHGVWKWQGSHDNINWADIGTTFTLGGSATQTITNLSANVTGYLYYRILGVSGNASNNPYVYEFEFKIDGVTLTGANLQTYAYDGTTAYGTLKLNSLGGAISSGASWLFTPLVDATNAISVTDKDSNSIYKIDTINNRTFSNIGMVGKESQNSGVRFSIWDNAGPGTNGYVFECHADDDFPYIAGWFNDSVSSTIPSAAYYINSTGDFNFGTVGNRKFQFFTNGTYGSPSMIIDLSTAGAVGGVGIGLPALIAPSARLHILETTTTVNTVKEVQRIETRVSTASTGASAGFGPALTFYGESSVDTTYRQMGQIDYTWATATDASRKARGTFWAYDTAAREGMRIEASGSSPMIGFLGAAAVAQQANTVAIDTLLVNYGLLASGGVSNFATDIVGVADTYWTGDGSGLPYGSCSDAGTDLNWTQVNPVQNTWYDISDADMVDGELNLVTHDGNGQLTVSKAGRYFIHWGCGFEASVANKHLEIAISVNGTENTHGKGRYETKAVSTEGWMSDAAILDLAASTTINLSIRTTDDGAVTLTVHDIEFQVIMLGGT